MSKYSINDVKIIADGLDHPECVAVHADGSLWAGGEGGQIYKIHTEGTWQEIINTGGFILGLAFSPNGWMAICDLKNKCLWRYELITNTLSLLASEVDGQALMTPNFPVFDSEGNLYVSDSGHFRQHNGRIYKFDKNGNGHIWHSGPFPFANGMALSVDASQLYVASTWLPGVEAIAINADGSAGERKIVVQIPETCPDGIAFDAEENLYISCYAPNTIYKWNKTEGLTTLLHDWEAHTICNPTNIAFGGKDGKTLFIANLGRWHIASLQLEISGHLLAGQ